MKSQHRFTKKIASGQLSLRSQEGANGQETMDILTGKTLGFKKETSRFQIPSISISRRDIQQGFAARNEPLFTQNLHLVASPYPVEYFNIQNRRYLGNKFKLLDFIQEIIRTKCSGYKSVCDIFAGTGVVGDRLNSSSTKIISNELLFSNFVCLKTFLGISKINATKVLHKIALLNSLKANADNYFSQHYGGTFFTQENARKIGLIRETINETSDSTDEHYVLLTALLYAVDKVANTVGHYDAFRHQLDTTRPIRLLLPEIRTQYNSNNEVFNEDANDLVRKIKSDVLYIDPPYNSRQYSDTYHLLENLAVWEKPVLYGKARKMNRAKLKSAYCLKSAGDAFEDLIAHADCKHILVSYNNTRYTKHGRSNARISDDSIIRVLRKKGAVMVFEKEYKAFTTGRSVSQGHTERIFYCKVK